MFFIVNVFIDAFIGVRDVSLFFLISSDEITGLIADFLTTAGQKKWG